MIKGLEDIQKLNKDNLDATVKSFGEFNKGFQAIASEISDYTKKSFEDGTKAFEKVSNAKSLDQAFEIQTTFAKKSYDTYVAEVSKLGELYVGLAKGARKPVEKAINQKA